MPHLELTLKGHEESVNEVAFIHGTRLLVTGSDDKSLRVWNLDTGKQVGAPLLGHDSAVWRVAASPDGRWVVSGGDNGSILVWEVGTNKPELKRVSISFKGHEGCVRGIVFAPDSETFASASVDKTVCVWKRETGKIVFGPFRVGSGANFVSFSPDGRKLTAGTEKHIIVWNTKTGEELLKIEQRAWRVAFTPDDGLRLVSGCYKDIRILDATTGDTIKQLDAHSETLYSLVIAPSGTKFATTSYDKMTRFFDLTTFELIGEPFEHPDAVWGVAFSEDSQLVATCCDDKLVRIWTVPLSESELQQPTEKLLKKAIPCPQPRPRRALIPTNRFFDDFDSRSPPGRNNRAASTTRNADSFQIKNMIMRIFSRSSATQGHPTRTRSIPLVDVAATRGKYRTANRHSGKRHKLAQLQRPPRQQTHANASSRSTPPAVSNVIGKATPAMLHTRSTSAANRIPSSSDVERVTDIMHQLLCSSRKVLPMSSTNKFCYSPHRLSGVSFPNLFVGIYITTCTEYL